MKKLILLLSIVALTSIRSQGQNSKTSNTTSIAGFSLCKSTISALKAIAPDLKQVKVEEMDNGKNCIAKDSRFENGIGYSSKKFPGMIFQKEEYSDLISKIRLTNEYVGQMAHI